MSSIDPPDAPRPDAPPAAATDAAPPRAGAPRGATPEPSREGSERGGPPPSASARPGLPEAGPPAPAAPGRPACGRPADYLAGLLPIVPQPLCPTLVAQVPSTPIGVREALVSLRRSVGRLGLGTEAGDALEVTLAEALNNIVEHAYAGDPEGWIVIEVDLVEGWAVCRLWDAGRPMPDAEPPAPSPPDLGVPLGALPEGGFGWSLIRALAPHLRYDRVAGRNCLAFALRDGAAPATV